MMGTFLTLAARTIDELFDFSLMLFFAIFTSGFSLVAVLADYWLAKVWLFSPLRYFEESYFWSMWVFLDGWLSARDSPDLAARNSWAVFLEELKSYLVDDDFCILYC